MEEAECIKDIIDKQLPEITSLHATMEDGKPYVLPLWRMNEIILLAIETLSDMEYYNDDFDYKNMIQEQGIKIKEFSSFASENLEKFKNVSLSLWNEGVCAIFPDPVTGEQCRMIAYNDSHNDTECMQIVFHEFAHVKLHHTQQSINGEVEATCFALAMSVFVIVEQLFHVGKIVVKNCGKTYLVQGIKDVIKQKEVA
ncbi:MAG: ImmA/IrrE family metallo-endopeptidase [Treponema sp.]|nr:ImmA/IrrE family metallo-endopeptidase [Treponema sp.]